MMKFECKVVTLRWGNIGDWIKKKAFIEITVFVRKAPVSKGARSFYYVKMQKKKSTGEVSAQETINL